MHTLRFVGMSVAFACVLSLFVGCGSSGGYSPVTLRIGLDDALAQSGQVESIEVDVVGLRESEAAVYDGLTIASYWRQYRDTAESVRLTFGSQDTDTKSVDRNADIWSDQWSGVTKIAVLAAMSVDGPSLAGDADKRIEFIDLDKNMWPNNTVQFRIGPNGLRRVTTPRDAS